MSLMKGLSTRALALCYMISVSPQDRVDSQLTLHGLALLGSNTRAALSATVDTRSGRLSDQWQI